MGRSWATLGAFLGALGRFLSALEPLLDAPGPCGPSCSTLSGNFGPNMAFPIDLGSILDALGSILVPLGSILGAPEGDFLRFFCALSLDWADALEEAATYEKPTKTYAFTRFFPCSLLRARHEDRPKILASALFRRVARRIALRTHFFLAYRCQNGLRELPRAP